MKIASIIGARPQFIKAAPVSREIRREHTEILIHTGQHYDHNMSRIFFDELDIPEPDYNLSIGSGLHGEQTGKMLAETEKVLLNEKPEVVLVYGDTNSTLSGALAAAKLHIPVAHIESGLRSYNKEMPEEINRVLTDHISDFLFCPTQTAVNNLAKEGITKGVYLTGDVMLDAVLHNIQIAEAKSTILATLNLEPKTYYLATVHRPSNTDNLDNLKNILEAFEELDLPVVFPLHPRTRNTILSLSPSPKTLNIKFIEPVGYLDMLKLENNAQKILTDSGGIQKEAYFLGVPCVTLREETEWVETLEYGWNMLVGSDRAKIVKYATNFSPLSERKFVFGDGTSSKKIIISITQRNFT